MSRYILDSNIFIDSHQRQYGMGFCPGFWDWLVSANKAGRVFSIDRVCEELEQIDDELCQWVKCRGADFFLRFDSLATNKIGDVAAWTEAQSRFTQAAKSAFFKGADMYIVAYALAHGCTVVTQEMPAPESKRRVLIPDVCVALGVSYLSLWDLLRIEGPKFVLAP